MRQEKVHAVMVAFNPEEDRFVAALQAAAAQVRDVVVVDNGSRGFRAGKLVREQALPGCALLSIQTNVGVAAAQNAGIRHALAAGADYVLLLDDDSIPGKDMLQRLLGALREGAARGEKPAAAGPKYVEQQSGAESHFLRYGFFGAARLRCASDLQVLRTDLLIASGMLITAEALRDVGLMDEALFIDHVDTDWCMRARSRGYQLLGVCAATLSHRLGDRPSRSIAGRRIFLRTPDRHYYMFRNTVLLYRRPHTPRGWALGQSVRMLALFLVIAACCAPRAQHIAAMMSGIIDGFRRRTGPRAAA